MADFITLGPGGIIAKQRIIAVAAARSAPVKRVLLKTDPKHIVSLTYGYPRESVLFLEGGLIILASLTIDELSDALGSEWRGQDEPTFK